MLYALCEINNILGGASNYSKCFSVVFLTVSKSLSFTEGKKNYDSISIDSVGLSIF